MTTYAVYMMASQSGTLYIGVTSNLPGRVYQYKENLVECFTKKYGCHKLVYFEVTESSEGAIAREKQLKRWRREKKVFLIHSMNPDWKDLYETIL